MSKAILHEKQILIVLLGSILIFIGYNVLTAEASEKNDSPKEICKDYDGKWKDGSCTFPNDNERHDSEVDFDHTMEEKGLWDDYVAVKQEDKKFKEENEGKRYVNPDGGGPLYEEELTEEEKDYYEEIKPEKVEKYIADYNEKEKEEPPIEDVKIPVTTLTFNDEEQREKYEKEMEKYEVETIEPTDDGTPDPDPVEESSDDGAVEEEPEEEESDDDESEDDEQEEDEPEEDNSDSES